MKPGEKDLCVYLMEQSERRCTREIAATDAQVTVAVGAASRTLCNARKTLQERRLIQYRSGQGNKYTYVICDPKTGQPYPGDPRVPLVVPKRNRSTQKEPPPQIAAPQRAAETNFAVVKNSETQRTRLEEHGLPGVF